jgi:predicted methyltransferase
MHQHEMQQIYIYLNITIYRILFFSKNGVLQGGHVFWVKSGDGDVYPDAERSRRAAKSGVVAMAHVMHGKIDIVE